MLRWISDRDGREIGIRINGYYGGTEIPFTGTGILLKRWNREILPRAATRMFSKDIFFILRNVDETNQKAISVPRFFHITPDNTRKRSRTTANIDTTILENRMKRDKGDSGFFLSEDFPHAVKLLERLITKHNVTITVEGMFETNKGLIWIIAQGTVQSVSKNELFIQTTNIFAPSELMGMKKLEVFLEHNWLLRVKSKGKNRLHPTFLFYELGTEKTVSHAITVEKLSVSFGPKQVLKNVAFEMEKRHILGVIGESGAGKTTLIKSLLGEIDYTGTIMVYGVNARKRKIIAPDIGYIPQELSRMYSNFNPLENILAFGSQYNIPQELLLQRGKKILEDLGITESRPVASLSGGQKRRVSIAIAMCHNPRLLILDEPTSGLDPDTRYELWGYLDKINKEYGITLVVISHYLNELEFCDKACIFMREVGFWDYGSPEELKRTLPGEGLAFEVTLETVSLEAKEILMAIPGIVDVIQRGERLRLLSDLPSNELSIKVLKTLGEHNLDIHSVENKVQIDMIDYFTHISKLRDEKMKKEKESLELELKEAPHQ